MSCRKPGKTKVEWDGGFSLVEVVSSLGIVSFGLVALLGLLPVGLKVSRDSRESMALAQITQYLSSLVQQVSSDKLQQMLDSSTFYYFDEQGVSVAADSTEAFYKAFLSESGASGTVLPSTDGYASSSLATLQIHLKKIKGDSAEQILALHRVRLN